MNYRLSSDSSESVLCELTTLTLEQLQWKDWTKWQKNKVVSPRASLMREKLRMAETMIIPAS